MIEQRVASVKDKRFEMLTKLQYTVILYGITDRLTNLAVLTFLIKSLRQKHHYCNNQISLEVTQKMSAHSGGKHTNYSATGSLIIHRTVNSLTLEMM